MAAAHIMKRESPRGERHELSAFAMRALMAFLGASGTIGCLYSGLGLSLPFGVSDIVIVLGSVLFTDAMIRTGYHPYCAACEAVLCIIFGIVKGADIMQGITLMSARYANLVSGGANTAQEAGIASGSAGSAQEAGIVSGSAGSVLEAGGTSSVLEAGNEWTAAFLGAVLLVIIVWILGQQIRRFLPLFLITGIVPALSVSFGVTPGYMYLAMLCLFWAMLIFDADELWGPSLIVVPVLSALFLAFLAAGVAHSPHEQIDFSRPMGTAQVPTTVSGENHDPVTETESTGETLENNDDPEDAHPEGESEMKLDGRDEDGLGVLRQIARILIVILAAACILCMIPLSRQIRLRLRRKKTHSKSRNFAAISEYGYMEQLAGFAGEPEDVSGELWLRATEIGLKAKFSGGTISAGELSEMHSLSARYRDICMRRVNGIGTFYGKYYLAL